jgi:two-component system CAI-1 autoinducer sensor kinase/phosphatase CqsS
VGIEYIDETCVQSTESFPTALHLQMTHFMRNMSGTMACFLANALLNLSNKRIKVFGALLFIGHPVFGLLWTYAFPQPYENPVVRVILAGTGLYLFVRKIDHEPVIPKDKILLTLLVWLNIPVFFVWMYFKNDGNLLWIVSLCAAIFIAYGIFLRTQATVSVFMGLAVGAILGLHVPKHALALNAADLAQHAVLLAFCWTIAAAIAATTLHALEAQKRASLETLGIVAHELRSPLAALGLITNVIEAAAAKNPGDHTLTEATKTMRNLTTRMNHLIDTQISNARLGELPQGQDAMRASQALTEALAAYPFNTTRERESVEVIVEQDFEFIGSKTQFQQVLDNLFKNALHSLRSKDEPFAKGDLSLRIRVAAGVGEITVADRGKGIDPELRNRIFDSFFSTNTGVGHGLGLSLCRSVMKTMKGAIRLDPPSQSGASFTLEIPIKP